jgi:hypothetical protein
MTTHNPQIFQAVVIASALKMYANTGMMANRAYTPKNMMCSAAILTGKKFKARDYLGAADALLLLADEIKEKLQNEQ